MKRSTSIFLLLALCLVASPIRAADAPEVDEKDVVVVTEANFEEKVGKSKFALVEFYAPWCGHCKNLKAPWAEAATKLKEYDESIVIAKVDATEEKELGTKFSVKGFPTIKWFVDGKEAMDYKGGRSASDIVNWIKKKTGPPSTVVEDAEGLAKAKKEEVALFAYLAKLEGEDNDAFDSFASKTEDAAFFKITDAKLAKEIGLTKVGTFAVGRAYPDFDFETVSSAGHASFKDAKDPLADRLEAFLTAEKLPAYLEFSPATSSRIFGSGIDNQVIIVAPASSFEAKAAFRKELLAASTKTRGQIVWVTGVVDADTAAPILNFFGLDKDAKDPQIVGFQSKAGKKFVFPEGTKVNTKNLVDFAEKVVDGTAPRKTKSAAVPENPEDEGVTVVVGSTFESIVRDPTKDVLLEIYAPWCGHCKSLAPEYVKLAKRFKNIDSVVIAKMDGTENEVADLEVNGYPTIKFFPAEKDAAAVDFDGARDLAGMTKFIKEHAKVAYELPKKGDAAAAKGETEEDKAAEKEAENEGADDEEEKEEGHDEL